MPRTREERATLGDLEAFSLDQQLPDLEQVYGFGLIFLEMLSDVSKQRGNYHTVGADKLHHKYLVTSNINSSKFWAGGASLSDLAIELQEEYNWSQLSIQEALRDAVEAYKPGKSPKR